MTGNPIHDLLESVSSGQPPLHRLSANDLVRAGRRRQRGMVLAAAGGTAAVVAGAAGLVGGGVLRTSPAKVGATTAAPLATTAHPDPSEPVSPGPALTTGQTTISTAHVLSKGRQVGTFLHTTGCAPMAILRIVSQDEHQVVLALDVRLTAGALAVRPSGTPDARCALRRPGPTATRSPVGSVVETAVRLDAPLGTRRLVDQATGRLIPYTADTQTADATWVPDGWQAMGTVRPTDIRTWEQDWTLPSDGLLSLRQTFDDPDDLGGQVNAQVNGQPARVVRGKNFLTATWWAGGRRYDLTVSDVHVCSAQELAAPSGCRTPSDVVLPLSQADLLRMADGVKARP